MNSIVEVAVEIILVLLLGYGGYLAAPVDEKR